MPSGRCEATGVAAIRHGEAEKIEGDFPQDLAPFWRNLSERRFFRATIDDDGPGLAAGLRQAAVSRGKRLEETKPGSGLGLSIVGDLAALYGGNLSLEDSPKADCARTSGCPRHEINRLAAKYL